MKVMTLAAGFAAGYVLGTRAGRDRYDQIAAAARKAQNHPAVAQAQQRIKQLVADTAATAGTASTPAVSDTEAEPTEPVAAKPATAASRARRRTTGAAAATGSRG